MSIRNVKTIKGDNSALNTNNALNDSDILNESFNPEYQENFHMSFSKPGWKLWGSFKQAKDACDKIHLHRGEPHTEFYKDTNNEYHCVVAIGNLNENNGHLYLTDSGSSYSLDQRLDQMSQQIFQLNQKITYFGNKIDDLSNNIEEFQAEVNTILDEIRQNIIDFENTVNNQIAQQDETIQTIIQDVNEIDRKTSLEIKNISTYISISDTNINASIYANYNKISEIEQRLNFVNNRIVKQDSEILNISNNIANINASINEVILDFVDLSTNISLLSQNIQTESSRNNRQDVSINALDSSIQGILEIMRCKCADIQKAIEQNRIQDVSIADLYSLVSGVQEQINELVPISDSSIYPLFHKDIYTINLCCYSYGGHIEINDYIAGYNAGGHNDRVAECTPFNEYKTYVFGDTVWFTAVPNPGYKFICWYKNANINQPIYDRSISYTFGNDVNVNGSLLDKFEPAILTNGYTARFRKLHQLKVSINQKTNNPKTYVEYFNDSLEIYITEPNQNTRQVSVEDAIRGNAYFDDESTIQIIAKPNTQVFHEFNKFIINNNTEYFNATYTSRNTSADLTVDAYFIEYWIKVHADASPSGSGSINIISNNKQVTTDYEIYYLGGSNITLSAIANEGYEFDSWHTDNERPSQQQFERDLIWPYTINDYAIKMTINKTVGEYELKATFNIIPIEG